MEELLIALLGEFIEVCAAEGLTYYEERATAWLELLNVNFDEHVESWEARRKELWAMSDAKWKLSVQ